jgi:uncharacterized protein (UPF0303 family)
VAPLPSLSHSFIHSSSTNHPIQPKEIAKAEFIEFPHFTSDDAYTLGTSLREKLRKLFPDSPAVVNITLANSNQLLYHACSLPGTLPDNDLWVARKRKTYVTIHA